MSSTTTSTETVTTSGRHGSFVLAVFALAMGGFAIGTTEFVTMGLLPQLADGVHESIPRAGHAISAYALGVVIGAPVLAFFGARLPRRGLLLMLMGWFAVANAATALAQNYGQLLLARFLSGVPHGAYFGIASLVAAGLAREGRKGRAVAMVMLGLSVANVIGVPGATFLGQHAGWRSAYVVVAVLGLTTVVLVRLFVPASPGDPEARGRRELQIFSNSQAMLALGAGAIGFGGLFAVFSYVAPIVQKVGGLPEGAVPTFLLVMGMGMIVGTWLAGRLADWSVYRSLLLGFIGLAGTTLLVWLLAPAGWWAIGAFFGVTVLASVLAVNMQLRLMSVAGEAQSLGAAMNHSALNIGNALGAWIGGVVIAAGYGYRAPALVGAVLALAGLGVMLFAGYLDHGRHNARPTS